MNIILLKDIDKVGDKNEVVTVKPGYARNFLIPKGLAIVANATNMAKLDDLRAQEAAEEAKKVDTYRAMADKLEAGVVRIAAKAGAEGKIFGSVTSVQLTQALAEQMSIEVPRKKIELEEEVKALGAYAAKVVFHPDVVAKLNFEVFAE